MAQVRHIARLEYGSSLPAGDRIDGDVAVFGSNGPVGRHNSSNTGSPVVVVGRKGSHGKLQYSPTPVFAIDTTYFIDPACTQANIRWLFYSLSTLDLDKVGQDVGVPGLSREYAYSQRIPVPSHPEQRAIADYLDTETNRIDTLITKKRRLIELHEERRHSVITAAVSGGLELSDVCTRSQTPDRSRLRNRKTEKVALRHFVTCLDSRRVPLNSSERAEIPGEYPYWGSSDFSGE